MQPTPKHTVSVDESWKALTADLKKSVCDRLASYSGSDVGAFFAGLVESAYDKQLATGSAAQMVMNGKRKLDDSDVAQPPSKKVKPADATASLKPVGLDSACPALRQSPATFSFGKPTTSFTNVGVPSKASLPLFGMPSSTGRGSLSNLPANSASFTAKPTVTSGLSLNFKSNTPAHRASDCDEHFTFADRRSSGPPPLFGPGNTHGNKPSAHNSTFSEAPAASSTVPPQGSLGSSSISTVYRPPFTGVDMSSLKVPANSNVNLTMNIFQAPSSLHQCMESAKPKERKCFRCKELYIETQNTAKACRRHTGRAIHAKDEKFDYQDVPHGAWYVWDCCRRPWHSRGCYPCNHYAG